MRPVSSEGWQQAVAALGQLDSRLSAALEAGDAQGALRLAFEGASEAVRRIEERPTGLPALHRLYVELMPQPLAADGDGTLSEKGPYVTLAYQRWDVTEDEAEWFADAMTSTGWAINSP